MKNRIHKELKSIVPVFESDSEDESLMNFGFANVTLPNVKITKENKFIVAKAELPGLSAKDINISVVSDLLTISGEKKQESKVQHKDYYEEKKTYGKFQRTVVLPSSVDTRRTKALYKSGMLVINMPIGKTRSSKEVKIKVS